MTTKTKTTKAAAKTSKASSKAKVAPKAKATTAKAKAKASPDSKGKKATKSAALPERTPEGRKIVRVEGKKEWVFEERPARVSILGYSAFAFFKWMGMNGYSGADARLVAAKYADLDLKPSTITTGIADGKNPKYNQKGVADVSKKDKMAIDKFLTAARKAKK